MTTHATASNVQDASAADGVERLARTGLAGEPFFLMARLSSMGSSAVNRKLAQLDLKVRHYSVLALACSGEEPTQRELGQFLVLDPSQIVVILDELERRGAVERCVDPRDRRSKIIAATPGGRELYEQARKLVAAAAADSLVALTVEEQDQLCRLLQKSGAWDKL